jgi:hypothetical protein
MASARRLGEELYEKYSNFPKIFMGFAIKLIKSSVLSRAKFDLEEIAPIDIVESVFNPALFIIAKQDSYVAPHHGQELFDKYAGSKECIKVEGDHLDDRGNNCSDQVISFLLRVLSAPDKGPEKSQAVPVEKMHNKTRKRVPKMFVCPISKKIMVHPVITLCMHTFEKSVIEMRIAKCSECPFCGFPLPMDGLKPNSELKEQIGQYLESQALSSSVDELIGSDLAKQEQWFNHVCSLPKAEQIKLVIELSMKIKSKKDLM